MFGTLSVKPTVPLPAVARRCPPLPAVARRCLPLPAVACRCLLLRRCAHPGMPRGATPTARSCTIRRQPRLRPVTARCAWSGGPRRSLEWDARRDDMMDDDGQRLIRWAGAPGRVAKPCARNRWPPHAGHDAYPITPQRPAPTALSVHHALVDRRCLPRTCDGSRTRTPDSTPEWCASMVRKRGTSRASVGRPIPRVVGKHAPWRRALAGANGSHRVLVTASRPLAIPYVRISDKRWRGSRG